MFDIFMLSKNSQDIARSQIRSCDKTIKQLNHDDLNGVDTRVPLEYALEAYMKNKFANRGYRLAHTKIPRRPYTNDKRYGLEVDVCLSKGKHWILGESDNLTKTEATRAREILGKIYSHMNYVHVNALVVASRGMSFKAYDCFEESCIKIGIKCLLYVFGPKNSSGIYTVKEIKVG